MLFEDLCKMICIDFNVVVPSYQDGNSLRHRVVNSNGTLFLNNADCQRVEVTFEASKGDFSNDLSMGTPYTFNRGM